MNVPADIPAARIKMVEQQLMARGIRDPRVLEAFRAVARENFVPEASRDRSYEDHPVDIGFGQTISQPYIVALTCQALEIGPTDAVLEIGAGSGYQTAILSRLAARVVSVERIQALFTSARSRLADAGVDNADIFLSDGTMGCPVDGPFNAIAVSAAAPAVPEPLVRLLMPDGRMVIPVGDRVSQSLYLCRKDASGMLVRQKLCDCRFVPLVGRHGFSDVPVNPS